MDVKDAPKIICVVGMHRSGTSLIARLLNLSGVELGPPERLMPASPDNLAGYWEHVGIVELNDALLAHFGGAWDRPPWLAPGWETLPELQPFYARGRELIESDFAHASCWGWKDPRTTLLLPFWRRLLPSLTVVLCVRHPLDVARSLEARDGVTREKSLRLWTTYMTAALLHTRGALRIITHYESYFQDALAELAGLLRLLGLAESVPDKLKEDVKSTVAPNLRHHRSHATELLEDESLDPACRSLYSALLCASVPGDGRAAGLARHLDLLAALSAQSSVATPEEKLGRALAQAGRLEREKQELAQALEAIESSRGWRWLKRYYAARDRLLGALRARQSS